MRRFLQNSSILFLMLMAFSYSYSQQKGEVTDADGNSYPIVEIGTQKWMGKNLKTTKYNDGAAIDYPAADNSAWESNSTGAYAWYNNDEANKVSYGGLYNWHAVETGKVCPTGWRVPTDEDWIELIDELGGSSTAGGKIKITGTDFWFTPNTGATNESNFSAVGGGLRSNNGAFVFLKEFGFYWSSLPPSSSKVKTYNCSSNNGELNSENYSLNHGVSIRCIKDATVSEPTVTTTAITNIAQTTVTSGGNVTNDGGAEVSLRGVCWSTFENPTITNSKTENGTGVGEFTSSITGLTANTKYYVRAYATNSEGTGYGEQVSFTTKANVPTVTTTVITNIAQTTATGGGNVTNNGGADVTVKGVVWSKSENPTVADSKTENGSGNTEFTSNLTGLTANTKYYVRAYATNSAGTGYGEQVSFTTLEEYTGEAVTDIDGNAYPVVEIGTQKWMGKNLKTTKYNDGAAIAYPATDNTDWEKNSTGAYAWYNNDEINKPTYGGLYNWHAVETGKVCPTGWHVPTNEDWIELMDELGGSSTAGGKLKITGTDFWFTPNTGATNESNFSAVGGGLRSNDGAFVFLKDFGFFWSSLPPSSNKVKTYNCSSNNGELNSENYSLNHGVSIRCIKDATVSEPTVTTTAITNITQTTATSGGNVTNDSGAEVTLRGVCWSTAENPTITNSKTENGAGTGEFTSELTNLTANTKYYVRAYATNSAGTGYGEQVSFTTTATGEQIKSTTSLNVYPNPFTSELRIEYEKGIKQISITNISGQVVISKRYNGETSLHINTEMLGSGLYLIKAIDIEGNLIHIKVVKP